MFDPKFTITNSINNSLLEIERARGFLDAAKLKEDWIREMRSEFLLLETHHSTHIEGTHLTLPQARDILAGAPVAEADKDDRQELLNYKEAMDLISKDLEKGDVITEDRIRQIHRTLVKDVRGGSLEPGQYRVLQNFIMNSRTREIVYTPPPPMLVPAMMKEFVDWLSREWDASAVIKAGIAQFQFVHIHPFLDGNGRTARVLCTLLLYRSGYDFKRLFSLSEYYDADRKHYYDAIQSVRDSGMDHTAWLEYFCEGLRAQLLGMREKGEQAIRKDVLAEKT